MVVSVARPELDADGHLADASEWSPALAQEFAAEADIQLTPDHHAVIEAVRAFHAETGLAPPMRPLVRLVRERLGPRLGSSIALMRLFPSHRPNGTPRSVARIAGLPCPEGCR